MKKLLCTAGMPFEQGSGENNPCKAVFGHQVGRGATGGERVSGSSIHWFDVPELVSQVQIPPRPPKRQSKGCLFFCQSILDDMNIRDDPSSYH